MKTSTKHLEQTIETYEYTLLWGSAFVLSRVATDSIQRDKKTKIVQPEFYDCL